MSLFSTVIKSFRYRLKMANIWIRLPSSSGSILHLSMHPSMQMHAYFHVHNNQQYTKNKTAFIFVCGLDKFRHINLKSRVIIY